VGADQPLLRRLTLDHPPIRWGLIGAATNYHGGVAIRVLVVEPSRIVRRGIWSELATDGALLVAEAASGAEAISAAARQRPDVVVLDFRLPDRPGPDICGALLEQHPEAAIIVLSAHGDEASIREALDSGARAYLLKDADDLDLAGAIKRVLAGETVIDPRAAAALLDTRNRVEEPKLSAQELNVVRLVAEGLTNPEIGARLHLSRHTVKEYLSHAMRKLEATNRMEVVRKATELGLIEGVAAPPPSEATAGSETLVYNESGTPISSSDIKVTPLKIDKLETASEVEGSPVSRDT
jgi:DNA-binding NarL/FixJ family response regulator